MSGSRWASVSASPMTSTSQAATLTRRSPFAYVWVYQWLAYLQESLVEALS